MKTTMDMVTANPGPLGRAGQPTGLGLPRGRESLGMTGADQVQMIGAGLNTLGAVIDAYGAIAKERELTRRFEAAATTERAKIEQADRADRRLHQQAMAEHERLLQRETTVASAVTGGVRLAGQALEQGQPEVAVELFRQVVATLRDQS